MHHHVVRWAYAHQPIGPGYSGPDTYGESTVSLATADGQVSLGAWRYDGRLVSENTMGKHQIWVVIRGSAAVEIEGERMELVAGSAVCFEAPYGPKIVEARDGFEAVWIGVPRAPG